MRQMRLPMVGGIAATSIFHDLKSFLKNTWMSNMPLPHQVAPEHFTWDWLLLE